MVSFPVLSQIKPPKNHYKNNVKTNTRFYYNSPKLVTSHPHGPGPALATTRVHTYTRSGAAQIRGGRLAILITGSAPPPYVGKIT